MNTPATGQVGDYVAAVRAALSDLPDNERAEAIRDLQAHLSEVITELDDDSPGTVQERLGPPETYAAQLREAAGYGTVRSTDTVTEPSARQIRVLVLGYTLYTCGVLVAAYAVLAGMLTLTALALAATLLGALRVGAGSRSGLPGRLRNHLRRDHSVSRVARWAVWVLCALGANLLLAAFLEHSGFSWDLAFAGPDGATYHSLGGAASPPWDYFKYWPVFQNIGAFVLLVLTIVASVLLGLRRRKQDVQRILALPVNLALVLTIVAAYVVGPFIWP